MEGKYSHRSVKTSRKKPYRYYIEQTVTDESGIPRKKTLLSKSFTPKVMAKNGQTSACTNSRTANLPSQ
jgi:hypothetical protein